MRRRLPFSVRLLAVLFVLGGVGAHWRPDTGFTSLIRFGHAFDGRRLPAIENPAHPLAVVPGAGYDGEFYAQLAVNPDVTAPEVQRAIDVPAYRARRILLPLVAHGLGVGNAWATLQIYALLNTLVWLVLAWCWWRWLPEHGARGTAVWLLCLLSLGALDSVRLSLTDLPMMLCLALAVRATETGRTALATFGYLAAGFVRETAVIAALPLEFFARNTAARERLRAAARAAVVIVPVAIWCVVLTRLAPGPTTGFQGNIDWPGFGFAHQLATCARELARGNFDSRYLFGLIGAFGFAYQSIFVLVRWRTIDPWLRLGLPFAVLFWLLGDYVWHGYWAVARTILPLTFAFNRVILAERRSVAHLIAGNLCVLHSVYRFLPF